jgi:hypothetical protein
MQPHWAEGTRQQFAIKVAGWLARLVRESIGINENEGISAGTFCPIGTPEIAESMLDAGAAAFLPKEAIGNELYSTIQTAVHRMTSSKSVTSRPSA